MRVTVPSKLALLLVVLFALLEMPVLARAAPPAAPAEVTVLEHLGAPLPRDATFRDHHGAVVRLGDLLDDARGRPVLLGFMYHRCAMLCSVVLDALARGLAQLRGGVGVDFDVITISLDPSDGPEVAARKRAQILARYGRPSAERGWRFLVGDEPDIARVASAVGFGYVRDRASGSIAHPAALIVIGPDGRVAGYLYGVENAPSDLERAWMTAADGRRLPPADRLLLACQRVDGRADGVWSRVLRALRVLAVVTLIALTVALAWLVRRARARRAPRSWVRTRLAGTAPRGRYPSVRP